MKKKGVRTYGHLTYIQETVECGHLSHEKSHKKDFLFHNPYNSPYMNWSKHKKDIQILANHWPVSCTSTAALWEESAVTPGSSGLY